MVEVVAALTRRNGKFLICRRPPDKSRAMLWEFVGGKVEKGETKEAALIRECREELDIDIKVGDIFYEVIHEYPDIRIHLTLFNAEILNGEPKLLEHSDMKWIDKSEMCNFEFCPADKEILEYIRENL